MTIPAQRTRRDALKLAAWSVPVIAAVVAVPMAAASTAPAMSRLAFTNATATEGHKPNVVYVNTKLKVLDGPDPVNNVTLTVTLSSGATVLVHPWPALAGWGVTDEVKLELPYMVKGAPIVVSFKATADDCAPISAVATVNPPEWWA